MSAIYIDDCYLEGNSFTKDDENVSRTIEILQSLGFYIKIDKSEIIPKQQITFFGDIIDSLHMKTTLTIEKKKKIEFVYSCKINSHSYYYGIGPTRWKSCRFHGNCPLQKTFLLATWQDKIKSLQQDKGNFEAKISLLYLSKKEVTWWEINVMTATKILKKLPIDTTIYTDASLERWGGFAGERSDKGNIWTKQEQVLHINVLLNYGFLVFSKAIKTLNI